METNACLCNSLFFSNLIQSLYGVADLMIVSYFGGTESVAGVNTSGSVIVIITNLATGIAAGGTVLIGQFLGAEKRKEIKETISTMFITLAALALFLTLTLSLCIHPLLRLLNTPQEAYGEAYGYMLTSLIGIVFIFGYNAVSAAIYMVAYTFPGEILLLFGAEPQVVEQGMIYMSSFRYEYVFVPVIIACNAMFLGDGKGWILLVTNLLTSFIVRIPVAMYLGLTKNMGIYGIGISVPFASMIGALFVVLFYLKYYQKTSAGEENLL